MMSWTVVVAVLIALTGWFATLRVISASQLKSTLKRWLLVPSWIPWMLLALGAPILSGGLVAGEALNIGGALTIGMVVAVVVGDRRRAE